MGWRRRRSELTRGFTDLEFVPPGRCVWDCTLSGLTYGMRMDMPGATPDLNAWATRHGIPGSGSYARLGAEAMVLWHGTSRERAGRKVNFPGPQHPVTSQ